MNAGELYKAGRLRDAIEAQVEEVKANPTDQARRLFLFELLAFEGDLDRARKQIDAIRYEDIHLEAAVASYRVLLGAEQARRGLFRDGLVPKFLGDPPDHLRLRLEAVNRLREGRLAEAAETLGRADAAAPVIRGRLNGEPFDLLRDADDLFGTVLELEAHGDYYWVPLEQVEALTMGPPRFPRDLLWIPARLETNGASGDVFLPALYPGSHDHPDDAVKLGRLTDWKAPEGGPVLGMGARLFVAGEAEVSLLDWREFRPEPRA